MMYWITSMENPEIYNYICKIFWMCLNGLKRYTVFIALSEKKNLLTFNTILDGFIFSSESEKIEKSQKSKPKKGSRNGTSEDSDTYLSKNFW